jgi:hypothetical protein
MRVPQSGISVDVTLAGAVSNGAVNTAVLIWPTVTDPSNAFTLATSANAGDSYTCNRPGIWSIDYFWADAAAAAQAHSIAISINASAATLNSNPIDFAVANNGIVAVAGNTTAGADLPLVQCSRILRIAQGDVLRFLSTVALTPDVDNTRVFMHRISP